MTDRRVTLAGLLAAGLTLALAPPAHPREDPVDAETGWTPKLQMRFREVRSTAVSPDGSRVAFVVRHPVLDDDRSEYREQIWLARADASDLRQLTWREQSSTRPAFAPDGRTLAFLSERPGAGEDSDDGPRTQIWVIRVDGGEAREVSDAATGVTAFAWSPAGDRIAYLSTEAESEAKKQAKKEKSWVETVDRDQELSRLWVASFDAGAAKLGEARQLGAEEGIHVTDLDWSPDGERIAIAHHPDPSLDTRTLAGDLSVVDVGSGGRTPLVTWEGNDVEPRFSPDGGRIAFTSHGGSEQRVGLGDVFVVDAAGGEPVALAHTPDRNASIVGWTSSGELLVSEAWHTERGLYRLPADGSAPRRVDAGRVVSQPSLASAGDVLAFVLEDASTPEDVFVARLGEFAPRRLSDLHADVELPLPGRTERLSWRSADGTGIEGLLTYPVGYAGGPVPLVLNIHGGPAGVFSETFTGAPAIYMIQTFAQRGYAVLRPNPRGSRGYGRDFRYANVRDWCRGDYEDVMSGVDAVVERGVADPERLFVMGWSYGGYMTSCVVSRTARFRAASMGAGLPNLVSMVHTTDIPGYLVAHMGGRELWEDYEVYMRHSPLFALEAIVTPTQILHGERDLRVPFTQGQELYVALKRKGVEAEMAVYPRTPHGPREPRLLMDVTPRILAWFERFLPAERGTSGAATGTDQLVE